MGNKPAISSTNEATKKNGTINTTNVQNTRNAVNPYAPAQSNLSEILQRAHGLANDGTFTPSFSGNTTQGLDALGKFGASPSEAVKALQPVVQGTGQGFQTGLGALQNIAGGGLIGGNDFLNSALKNADQTTADSVNAQFSAAGRYGSGAHTTALADQIGRMNTQALTGQYNTDHQNQQQAAGLLTGQGIQGAGLAPTIDAAQANHLQTQIAAGQGQDENAAAKRLAPYMATQAEAGLTDPIAALGRTEVGRVKTKTDGTTTSDGTTTGQTTKVQQSNPLTQGLGLGISALGGLKSAGGVGGLLSLFSDERVKENIRAVGKTNDGQKIYSYNYKGNPTPTMGLLAHEVEKKHPKAVSSVGGVKAVNYREATRAAAKGPVRKASPLGKLAG